MRRPSTLVAAVLVLGGCSATDPDPAQMGCGAIGCVPGTPTAAPPGTCTRLEPDPEGGRYAVGHAGWVTVHLVDDRLELNLVQPAEGWTTDVVAERDTELLLEFTRADELVDFDAVVEDGLIHAEHCTIA